MSYTGYLQHVMGVFLVPKQQHTKTNNSWRFLASQPVQKIWKFLTSKNTNYQQNVPLFLVVKFMESWDSMVQVTYHFSDTICASEGTAAQQPAAETAGWVTQTSISKWRPWTWPRTAAIAWGPSWCRLCSLSVPWLLGVASKHFSCNIKKNNLHPVLNFFQATCYPIFFPFWAAEAFFSNTGCVTVYVVVFFPRTFAGKPATASPIYNLPLQRQVLPHLWLVAQNILYGSRIWPGLIV